MERALEELPGVTAARVDQAGGSVHVVYEPDTVSESAMTAVIARTNLPLRMAHWLRHVLGGRRRGA